MANGMMGMNGLAKGMTGGVDSRLRGNDVDGCGNDGGREHSENAART